MRGIGRTLALATLGLGVLGCPSSGPVEFGAVLPLTGWASEYGQAIRNGIELAHEQVQAKAESPRVKLVVIDSQSDPDRAAAELKGLYRDGATAVIGGVLSVEALAMVPVADEADRVLLSPSATQPQLSGISSNFYRVCASDFAEGTVMARYAADNLRLRTGVVLAKEETYAKGIQAVFAEEFERKGGRIVEAIEFPANTKDFDALADRTTTLKPDFVYLAAFAEEVSKLIHDLRRHGFDGLILTTSSIAVGDTISETGQPAEGVYFTQTSFDIDGKKVAPNVQAFVDAYRAKYNADPDLYAAHGFDSYLVLIEAIAQGGDSPLHFWKGMRGIREYPGVTGPLQFDEKGDVKKFPHVYVVDQGRAIDVEVKRQEQIDKAREEMERLQEEIRRLRGQGG
jgi:branched-chain amino acid transport system substrate-binding protein